MGRRDDEALATAIASLLSGFGQGFTRSRERKQDRELEAADLEYRRGRQEKADAMAQERHQWAAEDADRQRRKDELGSEDDQLSDVWWAVKAGGLDKNAAPGADQILSEHQGDAAKALAAANRDYDAKIAKIGDLGLDPAAQKDFLSGALGDDTASLIASLRSDKPDEASKRRQLFDDIRSAYRGRTILHFLSSNPRRRAGRGMAPREGAAGPMRLEKGRMGGSAQPQEFLEPTMQENPNWRQDQGRDQEFLEPTMQENPNWRQTNPFAQSVLERARGAEETASQMTQGPNEQPTDRMLAGEAAMWYAIAQNPQAPIELQAAAWARLSQMLPIGGLPEDMQRFLYGAGISEEQAIEAAQQALQGGRIDAGAMGGQMPGEIGLPQPARRMPEMGMNAPWMQASPARPEVGQGLPGSARVRPDSSMANRPAVGTHAPQPPALAPMARRRPGQAQGPESPLDEFKVPPTDIELALKQILDAFQGHQNVQAQRRGMPGTPPLRQRPQIRDLRKQR